MQIVEGNRRDHEGGRTGFPLKPIYRNYSMDSLIEPPDSEMSGFQKGVLY